MFYPTSYALISLITTSQSFGFIIERAQPKHDQSFFVLHSSTITSETPVPASPTNLDPIAIKAKSELLSLASSTNRGFSASSAQRQRAKEIADTLSKYNPTPEPAAPFYINSPATTTETENDNAPTIAGKWTLCYTDAPDITTLDGGPLSTAKLGRIGQECSPPLIKNVIEWKRPDWAKSLPLSGSDESRVIQKVCCEATARPERPFEVDLKLVGLDLMGLGSGVGDEGNDGSEQGRGFGGGPAKFLEDNPLELRGVVKAPFGRFKILYLDDDMRIIRTYQNFLAVNVRDENEWF